jgi:soluble lytic murein transglycosylase-like protein
VVNDFYSTVIKKQNLYAARMREYFGRIKQLKDPTASSDWKRFEQALALFRKYGAEHRFDPLMLAAQGYQESQLDQNAKSAVGAIGIMQVMPATGAAMKVGDIRVAESNIHAGATYMDQLMSKYLADAKFDEVNRTLFAFACGQHPAHADGGRKAPPRSQRVVQQRGAGDRGEDRHRDHDVRAQYLQVLRGVQADAGRRGTAAEGARSAQEEGLSPDS